MTDEEAIQNLPPEDRVFLESLSDKLNEFTEYTEQADQMQSEIVDMLQGCLGRWSPQMRFATALVMADLSEQWEAVMQLVQDMREHENCEDPNCEVHGNEAMVGMMTAINLWVNLSMRIKAWQEALGDWAEEFPQTSETLRGEGYGRTDED